MCVCVCLHLQFSGEAQCCANTSLLGGEAEEVLVKQCGAAGSLITTSRSLTLPHHFRLNWEQPLRLLLYTDTHTRTHTTAPAAVSTGKLTFSLCSESSNCFSDETQLLG